MLRNTAYIFDNILDKNKSKLRYRNTLKIPMVIFFFKKHL